MSIKVTIIQYDANGNALYSQIYSNLILHRLWR